VRLSHLTLLAAAAVFAAAQVGTGATILHEPFEYDAASSGDGELTGKNGGTGFPGAWVDADAEGGGGNFAFNIADGGLSFPGLVSSGNAALRSDSAGNRTRANARAFDTTGLTDDGDTLYFSFLFQFGTETGGWASVYFLSDAGAVDGSSGRIQYDNGYGARIGGDGILEAKSAGSEADYGPDSADYDEGEEHLVIGRISFGATEDKVEIWLDDLTASGAADSIATSSSLTRGENVYLSARKDTAIALDELRLGETLADVTGAAVIPEPSTLAGLGLGGLLLALRRRRRAQA
jgi:hypothetical protein